MTTVIVTTAQKLSSQQLSRLKRAITKKHGKDVEFQQVLDPKVIGGIKVTIGSKELDATVIQKLKQLEASLV